MTAASDLPPPLVSPEIDLRDFSFTPMFRSRLFGSSFHARVSDAGWRAGVTLWLKSWDQVPAGSLPDDEIDLCRLAELGRDIKAWRKLSKEALWGWGLCSDGRLYHATVAQGVLEAWDRKKAQRARTEAARATALAKRQSQSAKTSVTETEASVTDTVTEPVTQSKGQGQGQGQGQLKKEDHLSVRDEPTPEKVVQKPKGRIAYPEAFLELWAAYPTDELMSKKEAFTVWSRLSEEDRLDVLKSLPAFRAYCASKPDYRPIHLCRFLTKRRADGFLEAAEKLKTQADRAPIFVKQGSDAWVAWVAYRGKEPPVDKDGGWFFPTEFPSKQLEEAH